MSEKDVKKLLPAVHPSRVLLAEQVRNVWGVTVPNETTKEDLLNSGFWAHVSRQFNPRDKVEVETEDGAYEAVLRVLDSGPNYARMAILSETQLEVVEPSSALPSTAGYTVGWSGRHTKWRVVRENDKRVMRDGFVTKSDANAWLAGHAKALAA